MRVELLFVAVVINNNKSNRSQVKSITSQIERSNEGRLSKVSYAGNDVQQFVASKLTRTT